MKKTWSFPGASLGISCMIVTRMAGQRWGALLGGTMLYLFDDYTLDTQLYELRHAGLVGVCGAAT
jgi:hypothetical protein